MVAWAEMERSAISRADAEAFLRDADFKWYQRFEGTGVFTPGTRDVLALLDSAGVAHNRSGVRVLDIGTTNGGVAFEAERRGADRVVATDIYPPEWFGFGALKTFLRSDVGFATCSVYDLSRHLQGQFDVVFLFGVLYHLRHPLQALDAVRAALRVGGEAFIETAVADHELGTDASRPLVRFYRGNEFAGDASNWFAPSSRALLDWCSSCSLESVLVAQSPPEAPRRCIVRATRAEGEPELSLIYSTAAALTRFRWTAPGGGVLPPYW